MKKHKPTINFKTSKILLLAAVVAVLVVGMVFWLKADRSNAPAANTSPTDEKPYKLEPATEQEKSETEQHKDSLVKPPAPPPTPGPTGKKQVSVVITSAAADNVSAYVSGVLEEGGTCTAVFEKDGQSVTRTSEGFSNVSTTNCAPITPSLPGSGTWNLTVSYNSAAAEGKTQTTVKVP